MSRSAARACRTPRALALGLGIVAALGSGALGCDDAEPPSFPAIPEPEQALRPESVRGVIPEQAHVVDYWIDARLDERAHEIHGTLRMAWRNRTARSVDRLPLHLYMNAFRAEDSAWMADARGSHRGQNLARDRWGFVDVSRVSLLAHNPAQPRIVLEQTPSQPGVPLRFGEDAEPSTMTVTLPEPVGAGESVVLELEFTTRLPQVFARTGYYGDFHMAGQWFPKIGVLEEQAGWQAHTFGLFSEFYADFGDYEVFLDVPSDYVVGATGVRVGEEAPSEGRKRLHYRAQMVHDFAWVADPNFIEHWGEYEGIRIRQLIQPKFVDDADTHLEAQKLALASMEARFGSYPWSTITIVHAPEGAGGAGGMEYPTLYTTSNIADSPLPAWVLRERITGVFTTVHEFGHQYFQGLFASNEHAQPWLDEGMNTTANQLVYWDAYGDDPWVVELLGHPLTTKDLIALSMLFGADRDPIDQPADRFDPVVESYGAVTYQKTAAVMLTLRELCGRAPWDRAMARYAALARFAHPNGALLERVLVEEIGDERGRLAMVGDGGPGTVWLDVQDYLDQGLRGAALPDFRLLAVGNRRALGDAGWHRVAEGEPLPPEPPQAVIATQRALAGLFGYAPPIGPSGLTRSETPGDWNTKVAALDDDRVEGFVVVGRRTSFRMPVEVLVEFGDGERLTLVWDGQADHHRFDFPGRRVTKAIVDPRMQVLLEARKLDNAAWAKDAADPPAEPLSGWLGDMDEAAALAVLGGLGI
ncbi:Zn-dependent aminopeptidase [Enhygromyxa salina]|uniref:Zn-dependent aminopeptidase n=1 Tax=Enhygromyxa salina TaxID=215803 RepID=A0A0C1ZNM9_9BACT|nr:M1 family metallopeptidase [Enhygromyxa salina]KIG12678.1 Zn-dependent aminopeptidase [Enhygromyxa salina]